MSAPNRPSVHRRTRRTDQWSARLAHELEEGVTFAELVELVGRLSEAGVPGDAAVYLTTPECEVVLSATVDQDDDDARRAAPEVMVCDNHPGRVAEGGIAGPDGATVLCRECLDFGLEREVLS